MPPPGPPGDVEPLRRPCSRRSRGWPGAGPAAAPRSGRRPGRPATTAAGRRGPGAGPRPARGRPPAARRGQQLPRALLQVRRTRLRLRTGAQRSQGRVVQVGDAGEDPLDRGGDHAARSGRRRRRRSSRGLRRQRSGRRTAARSRCRSIDQTRPPVDVLLGEVAGPRGVPALDGVEDGAVRGDDLGQQLAARARAATAAARAPGAAPSPAWSAAPSAPRRPSRRRTGRRRDAAPSSSAPPRAGRRSPAAGRSRATDARPAASRAAVAATAPWASPSSRRSVVPSSASRASASSASASSRARTKLPPPRPRRVSHQPELAQLGQRVAQGHRGDVEHRGQLGLRRQLLAVAEQAQGDRAAHPPDDGLAAERAVVERREHRSPRVPAEHLHARPPGPDWPVSLPLATARALTIDPIGFPR